MELHPDLILAVEVCELMADPRHKRSPPEDEEEEDVTPEFRREAWQRIQENKIANRDRGPRRIKFGEIGYLVDSNAALAKVVGTDSIMISRIIGDAKTGQLPDNYVDTSRFVRRIRDALHLAPVMTRTVRRKRDFMHQWVDSLSDEEFERLARELKVPVGFSASRRSER